MDYWQNNLDRILEMNDRQVLKGTGRISHKQMKEIVGEVYGQFDKKRKEDEARQADIEDMQELQALEQDIMRKHD